MKLKVFAIYDTKVGAYMQPFHMQTAGQALRAWEDSCQDQSTQFAKHPSDFQLFEIGTYDESTGTYENLESRLSYGTALQFKLGKIIDSVENRKEA